MFKNFLKIAWRNLMKNRGFTLINVLGLAMGLTCSLLIALWVTDEYKTDRFHQGGDRIYTLYERQFYDGKIEAGYYTPALLPEELKKVLPAVEYATGMSWNEYHTFATGAKAMKFEGTYAGEDFFQIFSFPLIEGNATTALNTPEGIAISQKMATSFFGSPEAAIHKTLKFENEKDLTVMAVFSVPSKASRKFDYLLNWELFIENYAWANDWSNNGPQTYLQLRAGTDAVAVAAQLKTFLNAYNKEQGDAFRIELGMQKFEEMYLHSRFENGIIAGGRIEYVRLFSAVAIFILLIACINFMNLTTAQSAHRTKEIGVRKVIGAFRSGLIRQFISESFLVTVFSVTVALIIATLFLPVFNELSGKNVEIPFQDVFFWIILLLITLVTSLISGSYPAFLLSSFKPVATLKGGKAHSGAGNSWLRKGLVVFQFILSIVFVAGAIVVSRQVDYIHTANLGYDKKNLLYIPLDGKLFTHFEAYKEEVLKIPGVESVSRISQRPIELENATGGVEWEGKDPSTRPMFSFLSADYDFVENMKVDVLEGRSFSKDFGADSLGYLINESALEKIGYQNPIGSRLSFWGTQGTIIGVVKDFHFNSLHVAIEPMIIRLGGRDDFNYALVRATMGKTGSVLRDLESLNSEFNPGFPFSHQFADQEYAALYRSEQTVQQLSRYFTFLALFISCLGLLGLAMYTAEQRTQEIGIRKVLGAGVVSLFSLLSREYLILIGTSFLGAVPLAFWALNRWLQNFTYRIDVDWWVFLVAGLSVIVVAAATISFQVVKVSLVNPAKTLRAE